MHVQQVAGHTLLGAAPIPEPGAWFRTDGFYGDLPVWVRLPREDGGHEDADALKLAWERLSHLDHPGIPKAVAFDAATGALLVAAPEGVPLARLLEHRHDEAFTMTPGTVLDVGASLADLLVHAHERGRPHGHLSPDVIWVTAEGHLLVWGFGAGPDAPCAARWWSPERARGKRSSGDADQWALAALLASLVTGRVPWRGEDAISEARVGDSTHLSAPVVEQWKPLGRLVDRALSAERSERFHSVHPMRQGIDALRQRVGQGSDLARMGATLRTLYAAAPPPPVVMEAEDAPVPVVLAPSPDTRQTEPLAPPAILPGSPLDPARRVEPARFETFDAATERPTSPTRIPFAGDEASVVEPEEEPDEYGDLSDLDVEIPPMVVGLGRADVVVPDPGTGPGFGDSATSPTSVNAPDVPIARREFIPVDQEWYEAVDMRRYAPFMVGGMIVLLGVYIVYFWLL